MMGEKEFSLMETKTEPLAIHEGQAVQKRTQSELKFKRRIADTVFGAAYGWGNFGRERYIGNARKNDFGDITDGASAFVDFLSHQHKFFVECKIEVDSASITRGLGQCLLYREFLPDYIAILAYEERVAEDHNLITYCELCWKYKVVLCPSAWIPIEVERQKQGRDPYTLEMFKQDRHVKEVKCEQEQEAHRLKWNRWRAEHGFIKPDLEVA